MDQSSKKQFFNSLENKKRELANIQSKIVNLRLLEKNLIKSIKKAQKNFKGLSLKESKAPTGKISGGLFFTEESCREAIASLLGEEKAARLLSEPSLLDLSKFD